MGDRLKYLLIISLFLSAFTCKKETPIEFEYKMTTLEEKAFETYTPEKQAFLVNCFKITCYKYCTDYQKERFNYCIREYSEIERPVVKTESNNTFLKSAVGAAVGYGAAKLILGRSKK